MFILRKRFDLCILHLIYESIWSKARALTVHKGDMEYVVISNQFLI